jgi:hypothetical protein
MDGSAECRGMMEVALFVGGILGAAVVAAAGLTRIEQRAIGHCHGNQGWQQPLGRVKLTA